jgi:hypothetical protein
MEVKARLAGQPGWVPAPLSSYLWDERLGSSGPDFISEFLPPPRLVRVTSMQPDWCIGRGLTWWGRGMWNWG